MQNSSSFTAIKQFNFKTYFFKRKNKELVNQIYSGVTQRKRAVGTPQMSACAIVDRNLLTISHALKRSKKQKIVSTSNLKMAHNP
jgi:hypothetical protein